MDGGGSSWEAATALWPCMRPMNLGAGVRGPGFIRSGGRAEFGRCRGGLKPGAGCWGCLDSGSGTVEIRSYPWAPLQGHCIEEVLGGFGSGVDLEFLVNAAHVGPHGCEADPKPDGGFLDGAAIGKLLEHFKLASGEPLDRTGPGGSACWRLISHGVFGCRWMGWIMKQRALGKRLSLEVGAADAGGEGWGGEGGSASEDKRRRFHGIGSARLRFFHQYIREKGDDCCEKTDISRLGVGGSPIARGEAQATAVATPAWIGCGPPGRNRVSVGCGTVRFQTEEPYSVVSVLGIPRMGDERPGIPRSAGDLLPRSGESQASGREPQGWRGVTRR
jgi:hypothetical protein